MAVLFVDTHCHLDDEQFQGEQPAVVARAIEAGVTRMVSVGTSAESSQRVCTFAARWPAVRAAVGIHPNHCHEAGGGDWDVIETLVERSEVVALGETGLDLYWDFAPLELQRDYFDRHLRLSQRTGLPFIVHMRDCEPEVRAMLREARQRGPLHGVMHSYTGSREGAEECLELGLYLSFAGMVTFKKSHALRELAALVPADRLLVETDAPYLSPEPYRGRRPNEPAWVVHTARCLAEVRGVSLEQFAEQTTANAERLFQRAR